MVAVSRFSFAFATALLFLALVLAGCAQQNPQNAQSQQKTVSITSAGLPDVSVSAGATVTWSNDDSEDHLLVFQDGSSPLLKTGAMWSKTFSASGNYRYECSVHPLESATVTVS